VNSKIVITDNESIHQNKVLWDLVEQAGHQLIFYQIYLLLKRLETINKEMEIDN